MPAPTNTDVDRPIMQNGAEFAEEHTDAERIRLVVVVALAGALFVAVCKLWFFPWLRVFSESAACRSVFGIDGATVLGYGLFVGIPLFATLLVVVTAGRRGVRIVREGRVPPSGEKVFRRTRIRRGAMATVIGYVHALSATPLVAMCIWGNYQVDAFARQLDRNRSECAAALSYKRMP